MRKAPVLQRGDAAVLQPVVGVRQDLRYQELYLESSNFEQVGAAMMDKLPIAMNSMVFEV